MKRLLTLIALLGSGSLANAAAPVDFTKDVQPILAASCVSCHGPQKAKSGIRVDTLDQLVKSGVVVVGNSAKSTLFQCLTGDGGVAKMPPKGRLTAEQMTTIKDWIDQGAKGVAGDKPNSAVANVKPAPNAKPAIPAKPPVGAPANPMANLNKEAMEKARERAKEAMEKEREKAKEVMEKAREAAKKGREREDD